MSIILNAASDYKNKWLEAYFAKAPAVAIVLVGAAANSITKVAAAALAWLPLNNPDEKFNTCNSNVNELAHNGFNARFGADHILPSILFLAVRLINPYSKGFFDNNSESASFDEDDSSLLSYLFNIEDHIKPILGQEIFEGPLTKKAHDIFKQAMIASSEAEDVPTFNLNARGLFLAGTVVVILAKSLELGAGLFLGAASILSLGTISKVNVLAIQYLSSLNGLDEATAGLLAVLNPRRDHGRLLEIWNPDENNILSYLGA